MSETRGGSVASFDRRTFLGMAALGFCGTSCPTTVRRGRAKRQPPALLTRRLEERPDRPRQRRWTWGSVGPELHLLRRTAGRRPLEDLVLALRAESSLQRRRRRGRTGRAYGPPGGGSLRRRTPGRSSGHREPPRRLETGPARPHRPPRGSAPALLLGARAWRHPLPGRRERGRSALSSPRPAPALPLSPLRSSSGW